MGQFTGKPAPGSGSESELLLLNRLRLRVRQKMSFGRTQQLQELQQIMQEMSKEIMWVNDREEEELMFDWGDKNIDQYIPRKQESYSVSGTFVPDRSTVGPAPADGEIFKVPFFCWSRS